MEGKKSRGASLLLGLVALLVVPVVAAAGALLHPSDAYGDVTTVPDELCETWVGGYIFRNQTSGKSDYSNMVLTIGSDGSVSGRSQPILKPGFDFTTDIAAIEAIVPGERFRANTTDDACCAMNLKHGKKKNTTTLVFYCGFDLVCPETKKEASIIGWGKPQKQKAEMGLAALAQQ